MKEQAIAEVRYAIRLCQRTARMYRRIQTTGTFLSIVSGSAAFSGLVINTHADSLPLIQAAGAALLALSGAALIAIRPADKAVQNEMEVRKYQSLIAKSARMTEEELRQAIDEARASDCQEVEPLRNVAFNDVMEEINRQDCAVRLTPTERMMRIIA